jgi:hypothetical protein
MLVLKQITGGTMTVKHTELTSIVKGTRPGSEASAGDVDRTESHRWLGLARTPSPKLVRHLHCAQTRSKELGNSTRNTWQPQNATPVDDTAADKHDMNIIEYALVDSK